MLEDNQVPDLVLLDVVMPGMSGWQTFKQMQKKPFLKDVPVVFVTVRDDNIARFIGGYLGDGYIKKPFDIEELKERVDNALNEN